MSRNKIELKGTIRHTLAGVESAMGYSFLERSETLILNKIVFTCIKTAFISLRKIKGGTKFNHTPFLKIVAINI